MGYLEQNEIRLPGQFKLWDITRPLKPDMTIYPGDPSFSRIITSEGAVTVSELRMGSHTGTHMDAPLHMLAGGGTIESLPIEGFIRPARVVAVRDRGTVLPEIVESSGVRPGEALLLKAPAECETEVTPIYLAPETAKSLVNHGVSLIGIDSLSVEAGGDEAFPVHRTLLRAGVLLLEGLNLKDIPEGNYHLIALPLLIDGGDGAPVRAVLAENLASIDSLK